MRDTDDDRVLDGADAFPLDGNRMVRSDGDGVGDNGDNCPADANPGQEDINADGIGDVCDPNTLRFGNFTLTDPLGDILTGGANDVIAHWDGSLNTTATGDNFNMLMKSESDAPFFGFPWTAHDIRVFGPGSYSLNTSCSAAELQISTDPASCAGVPGGVPFTLTVGPGQVGAHMLIDWNANIIHTVDCMEPECHVPGRTLCWPAWHCTRFPHPLAAGFRRR